MDRERQSQKILRQNGNKGIKERKAETEKDSRRKR